MDAQATLGLMYRNGDGVPRDYVAAYAWLNLAAAGGEAAAGVERDAMAEQMTVDQIADGQRMARDLWERIEAARNDTREG